MATRTSPSRAPTAAVKRPPSTAAKAAPRKPAVEPQEQAAKPMRTAKPRVEAAKPPAATPKPVVAKPAKALREGTPVEAARAKPKLVRDSFTIPKKEYVLLQQLKDRAAGLKRPAKKSEVIRAGIGVLNLMSDDAFLEALKLVPSLKTGRPRQQDRDSGKG